MSFFSRHKVKNGGNCEVSQDVCYDGTSARTRPFSFDEVMLRRKKKKEIFENIIGPEGADNVSMGYDVEEASKLLELNRNRYFDPVPSGLRHPSEDCQGVSSRKREFASSVDDKLARSADKGSRKPESNPDATPNKNLIGARTMEHKTDRRGHSDRKKDECSSNELKKELVKRHREDLVKKDSSGGKSGGKYVEERKSIRQAGDGDLQFRSKRKKDDLPSNDHENRSKKRDSKDLTGAVKHADRIRGKSAKQTKRKHQIEDQERVSNRYDSRKHGLGKRPNSDFPERKEKEASKIRHESKSRWRRSRSRERDQVRVRKSSSPKVQKHSSYDVQEHRDPATYSSKNRSGGLHSDTDRRRVSTNGSSSHYKRHAGSSSGLGGYSPRKRKSEVAARTPSPIRQSPEKRTAGWDLPPSGKGSDGAGGLVPSLQSSSHNVALSTQEAPSVIPVTSATAKPIEISYNFALSKINAAESIQLTQATRPMRRLYIENLPASASEKAIMEWINNSLSSSGVNYIQGTQPCISCMIHTEKAQALLEFLTPEDASTALFFDGRSFCGSTLKIRRPKDFIVVTTGVAEKSFASGESVSDFVEDSPHKIFIGGISGVISSAMILEIARAFGPLKAYHFEANADFGVPFAFLEYVDHSVTLKACAGLNGMKLGGQVLTVVQAIPHNSQVVNAENQPPFYGIPEHAKPLLHKPTQVLKLENMLDPEGLLSLSEAVVDEVLENVRLECSRFGTVRSLNVVKWINSSFTTDTIHVMDNISSVDVCELQNVGSSCIRGAESNDNDLEEAGKSGPPSFPNESEGVEKTSEVYSYDKRLSIHDALNNSAQLEGMSKLAVYDSHAVDHVKDEVCGKKQDDRNPEVKESTCSEIPNSVEIARTALEDQDELKNPSSVEEDLDAYSGKLGVVSISSPREKGEDMDMEMGSNLEEIIEPGCVLVEFKREEAACMAAHSLHLRVFDNRIVTVGYVDPHVYRTRYLK